MRHGGSKCNTMGHSDFLNSTCDTGHSDMGHGGSKCNTMGHSDFLNSTCDTGHSDMGHGGSKCNTMGHSDFLNSTCDIEENKRQRHATLPFLKIDTQHWDPPPPSKGPCIYI